MSTAAREEIELHRSLWWTKSREMAREGRRD